MRARDRVANNGKLARHTKISLALFAFAAALVLLHSASPLRAEKKPFFKLPAPPKNAADGKNSLSAFGEALKQKVAEETISTLLNNQLPLKLDANAVYPTVAEPPGGAFAPRPLTLNARDLEKPLPPGDYAIPMLAFCTEYSVHRPGRGLAYRLGPMQGRSAGAIAMLLWRGSVEKNLSPQQMQAVSWSIQSGITYAQMPKSYQAVIDNVIPEYKYQLGGNFVQSLEDTYQSYAKTTKLPPLDQLLGKMGKAGELARSARRQRDLLLRQNTNDERREQILFAGQESRVYTPVRAEEGPWTERIPGVAYLRFKIVGGNMARNNIMEVRILRQPGHLATRTKIPRLVYANYAPDSFFEPVAWGAPPQGNSPNSPTPRNLIQGSIGCAVGQGAQCLGPVPAVDHQPADTPAGKTTRVQGNTTLTRDGVTRALDPNEPIQMNDTITTGSDGGASAVFGDNSQITLGPNTKLVIDKYIYDPSTHQGENSYRWLQGAFIYASGLMGKDDAVPNEQINTTYGCICIRGTEFIARYNPSGGIEVNLIKGGLDVGRAERRTTPAFTAPITIVFDGAGVKTSPLTLRQYNIMKAQALSPRIKLIR